MSEGQNKFAQRHRIMTVRDDAFQVAQRIRTCLTTKTGVREALDAQHPADLADAMQFLTLDENRQIFSLLDSAEAAEVLDEVDATTEAELMKTISPDRLAKILDELPSDEGADVVGALTAPERDTVLSQTDVQIAADIRTLLTYPPDSAGGIMSLGFVDVLETATQAEALDRFRLKPDAEHIFFVYAVDEKGGLSGIVDLRKLLTASPTTLIRDLMETNCVCVHPECDQEQVAHIFARYDLTALPVTGPEPECRLLGVITADDIIDVIQEEAAKDVAHLSGSDAQELEKKSPVAVALLRMPWIMTTLFIELFAGFVIHYFNPTLEKYLLLASFMPIISAISGNTGLQSAAIIIRGLSTGQVQLSGWRHAVVRQVETTMLLGGACAAVLGIIGAVWNGHWSFGVVVFLGMFASVNIAGIVGTVVPLLSKRAGFDPALTAGPFETAFQDVVGISIFLSLASVLLRLWQ